MKNCWKCKHLGYCLIDENYYCMENRSIIPHPHFYGGPKKCECFEPGYTPKFEYPKKKRELR